MKKSCSLYSLCTLSSAVLLASLGSDPAWSQLEEVVVTAQKREQSLQEIPISVTAFDDVQIEARGITDVRDLAYAVPNVQIVESPAGSSGATISIRGASTINPAITWEPTVGMYLDGVFLGKNLGGIFDIAELQRVEVLRGPQGTLYGKNTTGGAINFITRPPESEFGGRADVSAGNFDYQRARFRIDSGKLGMFSASLSYAQTERDGFYENRDFDPFNGANPFVNPRSSDEFANLDSTVWRADLLLEPTDTVSLRYAYDRSERDQLTQKGQLTDVNEAVFELQGLGFLADLLSAYERPVNDNAGWISNDRASTERSELDGHTLTIDWMAGDWGFMGDVSLTSITAFRDLAYDDKLDIDGSNMDLFHAERHVDYEQFSQEFQLKGQTATQSYVIGLYAFGEQADVVNPISFFGLFGSPTDVNEYGMDNKSYAIFGQTEWTPRAVEPLTITAGLRYTEEERDQYIFHPNTSTGGQGSFDEDDSDTWSNVSGALSARWAFTDDISAYVRVAQGWKSGGFNGEAPFPEAFHAGYDEEEVLSYEVGLKSRLFDNRLQLNLAAFQTETTDMQVSVFLEGSGGAASNVQNAGEVTAQGLELEVAWQVVEPLRLAFNYGYLDSEYDSFMELGVDVKDQKDIPFAPENSASVSLDWRVFQQGWGKLNWHVDYSYNDDYVPYIEPSQNLTSQIDSFTLLNSSLILSDIPLSGDTSLQLSLWGKNLTDETYRQTTNPFGFWTVSFYGNPRTYGLEAMLRF
ncbi:TonB-dependent receptor [Parahaliea mediterranea]|uniref:TonB-dependent receptor n=1 Tax=Parahaliea mediterranea TaxID=651086 RepID=UPI000E2F0F54|nr:TonB-dependent receptor [Parahaliea mediterranea]